MYGLVAYGAAPLAQLQTQQGAVRATPLFMGVPGTLAMAPADVAALAVGKALSDNPVVGRRQLLMVGMTPRA